MDIKQLEAGLTAMSGGSATLSTWSLAILGGTIAAIIGSDYLQPTGRVKLIYLLFVPGWISLALSLYYGDQLNGSYMANTFTTDPDRVVTIGGDMNRELLQQRHFLSLALVFFGIWLFCFLLWWIFSKHKSHEKPH